MVVVVVIVVVVVVWWWLRQQRWVEIGLSRSVMWFVLFGDYLNYCN